MRQFYSLLTCASQPVLKIAGLFNPKLRAFVRGRKRLFKQLKGQLNPKAHYIWVHCASLGEYEQGLPIIEELRKQFPQYKILLTFFSPSGYLIKKDSANADLVSYLPLDTPVNAKRFIALVNPVMAIFVKYEFWPNFFNTLKEKELPTFVVSALFRENQGLFKNYGGWIKQALHAVTHFFVQNEQSVLLLKEHGFSNVTKSGDTRFDRVSKQIELDNQLDFMDAFVGEAICIVCGSTWPEDDAILVDFINQYADTNLKFVIAPHNINHKEIAALNHRIEANTCILSTSQKTELKSASVLIVDAVGLLSKIYSYGHIAYVGGAMGTTGLHNILEPATFGIPIVIGKNYSKFPEAKKLRELAGLYSVSNVEELKDIFNKLINDSKFRSQTGMICGHYVNSNTGATKIISATIKELYGNRLV